MRLSREEMKKANEADPLSALRALGYTVKRVSGNEYTLKEHDSMRINPDRGWYWNSRGLGGRSTVDLVMALEGYGEPQDAGRAILYALGEPGVSEDEKIRPPAGEKDRRPEKAEFRRPPESSYPKRAYRYLTKDRGLSPLVVERCMDLGILYESFRDHNAVFIGKDEKGRTVYALERGTRPGCRYVREAPGSKKEYGFRIEGDTPVLHVFESAIDALSYLTILELLGEENKDTLIALSGTSIRSLDRYLKDHEGKIREIHVRTDSDPAGEKIYRKIKESYGRDYAVRYALPQGFKDYNEVVVDIRGRDEVSKEEMREMIRPRPPDESQEEKDLNSLPKKEAGGKRENKLTQKEKYKEDKMDKEKENRQEKEQQSAKLGKVYGVIRESPFPVALAEIEREEKRSRYQIVTLFPNKSNIYWKGDRSPGLDDFELTRLHHILNERLAALEDPERTIRGISSHHMGPEKTEKFTVDEHWGMINSNRYDNARLEVNMVTFHSFVNEEGETIPKSTKLEIREWQDGNPKKGYRFQDIDEAVRLRDACKTIMQEKDLTYDTKPRNKLEKKPAKEEDKPKPKPRDDPQK